MKQAAHEAYAGAPPDEFITHVHLTPKQVIVTIEALVEMAEKDADLTPEERQTAKDSAIAVGLAAVSMGVEALAKVKALKAGAYPTAS